MRVIKQIWLFKGITFNSLRKKVLVIVGDVLPLNTAPTLN